MCRAVRCEKCGKTGWAGCGAHVEAVLAGVPNKERCACPGGARPKGLLDVIRSLFGGKSPS
ncbi:MAG: hypothetical protein HY908_17945 [Myxococcales bacterium]|nr:hypothetical protein [Myxococcales bacterium]